MADPADVEQVGPRGEQRLAVSRSAVVSRSTRVSGTVGRSTDKKM
jgi:hypothetical protein